MSTNVFALLDEETNTWKAKRDFLLKKCGGWTVEWGAVEDGSLDCTNASAPCATVAPVCGSSSISSPIPWEEFAEMMANGEVDKHIDLADLTQPVTWKKKTFSDGASTRSGRSSSSCTRSGASSKSSEDITVPVITATGGTTGELWMHGTVVKEQGFNNSKCGVVTATNTAIEGHRTFTFIEKGEKHFVYKQAVYFTPVYKGIGQNGGWVALVRGSVE